MTLNIPLARKVLEHLIAHPEEHDQAAYGLRTACGTTMCIAGTAVWLSDTKFHWNERGHMKVVGDAMGETAHIERLATELLGLSPSDSNELFYTMENAVALELLANHIVTAEAKECA